MKVMLVLPPLPLKRSSNDARWIQSLNDARQGYVTQPIVLVALASVTPPDIEVTIMDLTIADEEEMFARAEREGYALVGISAYTSTAPHAYRMCARFKTLGIATVLGGVHPTLLPEEAKRHCDAVVVGEAEGTWPQLLADFRAGQMKPFYRTHEFPDMTKFVPVIPHMLERDRYSAYMMETTRGCPFTCQFCTIPEVNGNTMRTKSEETLEAEFRYVAKSVKEDANMHFIMCVDSNFYGNRPHMHRVLKQIIRLREEGIELPYILVSTSLNTMRDPENLQLLSKAGVRQVYIGFESTELSSLKAVLKMHHRGLDYDEVVSQMRDRGIAVQASFILGHDTDTDGYIDSILDFCNRNGILYPELNILTPLPGSQLYALMESEGRVLHNDWEKYTCQEAVYQPRGRYKSPLDVEATYIEALERLADPQRLWETFVRAEKLMPATNPENEIGAATSRPTYMMHRGTRDKPSGRFSLLDRFYIAMLMFSCMPKLDRHEIILGFKIAWYALTHPISIHTQNNVGMIFDYRDFVKEETSRLREKARLAKSSPATLAPRSKPLPVVVPSASRPEVPTMAP